MDFLKTQTIYKYLLILTITIIILPKNVIGAELIQNGNFETNDLTGWTAVVNSQNGRQSSFDTYTGTGPLLISGHAVIAPPEGNYAVVTDQNGPSDQIIYQDITIPANSSNVTFSAILYLENQARAYSKPIPDSLDYNNTPNQQMRVDIIDPTAPVNDLGAGVLFNIFQTNVGDPTTLGYTNLSADLSTFAGQTIRIRIAVVDTELYFHGSIDNVSVDAVLVPLSVSIPTLSQWSLILLVLLLGFIGLRIKLSK